MPKENKASKLEYAERIRLVKTLILEGIDDAEEIRKFLIKYYFEQKNQVLEITQRQVYNYIAKCFKDISTEIKKNDQYAGQVMLKRFQNIFRRTMSEKSYREAISAGREINKIIGNYRPFQFDVTLNYPQTFHDWLRFETEKNKKNDQ